MFKFPLDANETFLILAPRWADFGTPWQVGLLSAMLIVPVLLILCLYRYELRLISRLASCGLLLLRLLLLLVIWTAIGLQPHVAEVHVKESGGRVRIAVDLSSSMDVADSQRTAAERADLARALHLPDVDELTRKQIVARMLSPEGVNLLHRLQAKHEIEIVGFHQDAIDLESAQLPAILADKKLEPRSTDVHQALTTPKQPLLGILLFSDGQHNTKAPPYERANELGKQHTPIFPVVIGSRIPPPDLMIADVLAKSEAFKDTTVPVEVRCKVTNMPAQAMSVEMQIDGKPARPEHRETIQHSGKDDVYTVRFQAKMDEVGTHALAIKATSKTPKEVTLANNVVERIIRVTDDKARILLVEGEARWEYHYLANALLRDPEITLERVVFSQPRIGAIKADDLDKAGLPKSKLPEPKPDAPDRDPLLDYDGIFLGDIAPEQLPVSDRKRLERFVAERGGTLIFVAGKRYLPLAFTNADKKGDDPLVKMLPIGQPRELSKETGFTLRITAEGKLQKFLNLDPDAPAQSWPELPKHFWGIVGKRKPLATVLAAPLLDPPASKDDADTGLIVQQNYGFGRVLFVGLDSTWRWRFRVGDVYHHRFWGQVTRWSAAENLLPAGNRWIRYGPRRPVYFEGDAAELAVRLGDLLPPLKDLSQARVKLMRHNADGSENVAATISLSKDARQPNLLTATVREAPGTYRMELDIPQYRAQIAEPGDGPPTKGRDVFRILAKQNPELLDLATNWTVMQSLADRSGGKLYTPDTVNEILDRLARRIERTETRRDARPWQEEPMVWWTLGLLLGLLTLEWTWRKWLELP